MTTRWDVESALMWSNLRPLARFVVLALATKSDANSGIIPAEFSPSLGTLHEMTGISKSQVVKELDYAEGLGWVKRSRPNKPSKVGRTSYAITVGTNDPERPTGPHHGQVEPVRTTDTSPPADESEPVRTTDRMKAEEDSTGPHHGQVDGEAAKEAPKKTAGRRQSAPRTSPHHGQATNKSKAKEQRTTESSPSSSTSGEVDEPNAGQILASWIDYCRDNGVELPKRTIGHYATEIKSLVDDPRFTAKQIKNALAAMFKQNATKSPSQLSSFIVEVQTGPRTFPNKSSPPPYQNPENQDDYDDWKAPHAPRH